MRNCLITKLKETVDNQSLPVLGQMTIQVNPFTTAKGIKAYSTTKDIVLKLSSAGTAYFTDSTGSTNLGKSITVEANDSTWKYVIDPNSTNSGSYMVDLGILSKYDLESLLFGVSNSARLLCILDGNEFKYSEKLNILNIRRGTAKNLSGIFKNKPLFEYISANGLLLSEGVEDISSVSFSDKAAEIEITLLDTSSGTLNGNLGIFNACKNLTVLKLTHTSITGELDTMFRAWSTAGKTSSLSFTGNGVITLNGTPVADGTTITVTFDGQGGYVVS